MGYVESSLVPGETVAYQTRLHWIVFAPALFLGGLLDLGGTALLVFAIAGRGANGSVSMPLIATGVVLMVIGSSWIAAGAVRWSATEITVTTRRVLIKTGVLTVRTTEVLLAKVESVAIEETALARALGFGKVTIHGTGGTPESFDRITRPHEFRRRVQIGIEGLPR